MSNDSQEHQGNLQKWTECVKLTAKGIARKRRKSLMPTRIRRVRVIHVESVDALNDFILRFGVQDEVIMRIKRKLTRFEED